jgi:hypothetical protein
MRKLYTALTLVLAAAAFSFGPTALTGAEEEENNLMIFNGFQNECSGQCPTNAPDGSCCTYLPPCCD